MNSRSLWLIAFALFSTAVVSDDQTERVQKLLERMYNASHLKNYDGTFVFSRNNSMNAMRIIHSSSNLGVKERIVSLDGNGREVIRNNNLVTCILPDKKSVVVEKNMSKGSFPPSFPVNIENLIPFYEFSIKEDCREKVAGRASAKISITPRDRYRYGYRLWVDRETDLLLKTVLLDENEKPIEQFMFTKIEYLEKVPEVLLQPEATGKEFTWMEPDAEPTPSSSRTSSKWKFERMLPGFKVNAQVARSPSRTKKLMDHLVLSDGLATVSVFIEKTQDHSESLQGGSRMGAVNAYGKALNGHHVTAVGEVPQAAVRLISGSIRHQ